MNAIIKTATMNDLKQIQELNLKLSKKEKEELLIEGCKEMAEENLKICEEWKYADAELDWECK